MAQPKRIRSPKVSHTAKPRAPKRPVGHKRATVEHPAPQPTPEPDVQPAEKPSQPKGGYVYAVGRRKSAVARVRLYKKGNGNVMINGRPLEQYFSVAEHQGFVRQPIVVAAIPTGNVTVRVTGGGIRSQAESVRHGLARALLLVDSALRIPLKRAGLLTRDPRVKERKKYGLKRARRAPQWQKR